MSRSMGASYELYDLEISVEGDPATFSCSHSPGYAFSVLGENLTFMEGKQFSLYSLGALIPLLSAKQRLTDPNDWMSQDELVKCPDTNCGARFRIVRTGKTTFYYDPPAKA